MKFLSICSGIEAASVAWAPLRWQCVGVSEIEPFPCAVLAHHFGASKPVNIPEGFKDAQYKDCEEYTSNGNGMINWGDFTKIDVSQCLDAEMLCGGPPCQSFSIAGGRKGLSDDRGNLTLKYVELAHELATKGALRWAFYENVPGILSDKTNAFGCLISGLVGGDNPFTTPDGGTWPSAGMASGPRARLAWRVLDAQYFGLAQQRKRVFVIVSFDERADPTKVLFEQKSGGGGFEPRHQTWENDTPKVAKCLTSRGAGGLNHDTETANFIVTPTLTSNGDAHSGFRDEHGLVVSTFAPVAPTLNAHFGDKQGLENQHIDGGGGMFVCEEKSPALTASGAGFSRTGQEGTEVEALILEPKIGVRRIIPNEAETLMGFVKDWTKIPYRGKATSKCPDGPRYKALGNSWPVTVVAWVGERIDAEDRRVLAMPMKEAV